MLIYIKQLQFALLCLGLNGSMQFYQPKAEARKYQICMSVATPRPFVLLNNVNL